MKRLWLLWSGIALCAGISVIGWQIQHAPPRLPFPSPLTHAQIIRQDATLDFTYHPQTGWQLEGQPAPLFGQWLEYLRQSCFARYDNDALPETVIDAAITLRLNQDGWHFGRHNAYAHAHYLRHEDQTYLCDEQLKPRLTLPAAYWTNTP